MRQRRSLNRSVLIRPLKTKIFIFSEGVNTEPGYFLSYEKALTSIALEIVCENGSGGADPSHLLKLAKSKRNDIRRRRYPNPKDQVWLVFDRDDHKYADEVLETCESLDIGTAFSDPCFELWLLLHHNLYEKDADRKEVQKACEDACEGYDCSAGKKPDYKLLMPKVEAAERRALELIARLQSDGRLTPLTTVYKLTQAMRGEEPDYSGKSWLLPKDKT